MKSIFGFIPYLIISSLFKHNPKVSIDFKTNHTNILNEYENVIMNFKNPALIKNISEPDNFNVQINNINVGNFYYFHFRSGSLNLSQIDSIKFTACNENGFMVLEANFDDLNPSFGCILVKIDGIFFSKIQQKLKKVNRLVFYSSINLELNFYNCKNLTTNIQFQIYKKISTSLYLTNSESRFLNFLNISLKS